MKKTILAITIFIAILHVAAFGQENKKTEKARKEVAEAQKDLRQAKIDSAEDFKKFKKEAEAQINENQKKIAQLKARKWNENNENKEKYDKKVLALEQKNNELRRKIETCDNTQTSMWTSFKREFNHDMSELGQALKDLGVDNAN
ncbi:MAG TPA: hypothetical protein VFL70_10160 [Bacteroidia bacterium]|nr:hypothetical protein [Bacteroidia bacterium]